MIEIKFLCFCIKEEHAFFIQERKYNQDIIDWMDNIVKPAIGREHYMVSPDCRKTELTYLKIPVEMEKDTDTIKTPIGMMPGKHK